LTDKNRIIVALDFSDAHTALELVGQLDHNQCRLKIGKELFTHCGPDLVRACQDLGFEVFLDLKFHDIPNTVAKACRAAADLGVWMVNVHASGGHRMMEAAREAIDAVPGQRPLLIAVTILTSMADAELVEIGMQGTAADNVLRLAALTQESALDGVVCSSQEVTALRQQLSPAFRLVTPGIRPALLNQADDQRRIMTPAQALIAGSDYLVIGRPITVALDPLEALNAIQAEVASVL